MSLRSSFSVSGSTPIIRARRIAYYCDFTTGSGVGSVRLMVRPIAEPWKTSNLWLPVTGLITATPLNVVEAGFNTTSKDKGFDWKIDVVITSGIITVDFFSVEQGL